MLPMQCCQEVTLTLMLITENRLRHYRLEDRGPFPSTITPILPQS
jgi:hypothetical protein